MVISMFGLGLQELVVLGVMLTTVGLAVYLITSPKSTNVRLIASVVCSKCNKQCERNNYCPHCGAPLNAN